MSGGGGERRELTRQSVLRERARAGGYEWWPSSKRSLNDVPTRADIVEVRNRMVDVQVSVKRPQFSLTQRAADALTAVSNVIFAVALLPTVLADAPPTALTSASTLVALGMLQIVLLHFRLWWGCVWNLVCASMWAILLVQGLS